MILMILSLTLLQNLTFVPLHIHQYMGVHLLLPVHMMEVSIIQNIKVWSAKFVRLSRLEELHQAYDWLRHELFISWKRSICLRLRQCLQEIIAN